jgi:uncharacterized membrane protein (DUF106 family)
VYTINQILNPLFRFLLYPFRTSSPEWGLLWISVLTAVVALLVYRFFSAQESIRNVKAQLKAHVLEMRLFQHDPVLMGRAVLSVLRKNATYLRLNLKPFLFMLLPVVLILIQMEERYGYRPLQPGDSVVLKTFWKPEAPEYPSPILELTGGLSLDSPALHIGENREIDWKIKTTREQESFLSIHAGAEEIRIPVEVSDRIVPVSSWNGPRNSLKMLFHPAAHPLPSSGALLSAEIDYPRRDFRFLGRPIHWLWPYLIISLVAGYALKGLFRVQI